jgi:hypothetical protein
MQYMNKLFSHAITMAILTGFAFCQDVENWTAARNIASKIGSGAKPSKAIAQVMSHYRVLLVDDANSIIVLQRSDGVCIACFPSKCDKTFYRENGIVITDPISLSEGDNKPVIWKKATLVKKMTSDDEFVILLTREKGRLVDMVKLNRGIGCSAHWKFGISN